MPKSNYIFISHASADDDFVRQLRNKLESHDLDVWEDSRDLRGGDLLKAEIEKAIKNAAHVLVVFSLNTINSPWVRNEIKMAEEIAKTKKNFRIIPLMLNGVEPRALDLWFKEERRGIKIEQGQLNFKLPAILDALTENFLDGNGTDGDNNSKPVAELILELSDPKLNQGTDGNLQLICDARLEYVSTSPHQHDARSKPFIFTSPISNFELEELRWYLEEYPNWPTGLFKHRAKHIEDLMPIWGKQLFDTVFGNVECEKVLNNWNLSKKYGEHCISIRIDNELPVSNNGDIIDRQNETLNDTLEATNQLFSLPWELLHDGNDWLNQGTHPVYVRRCLPSYSNPPPITMELPIRILLISPRPENNNAMYIDHRATALPLIDAISILGDLAEIQILTPPTLPSLEAELKRANAEKRPYHVLHFDGHGIYDSQFGLGALCFETPIDNEKCTEKGMQLVYAKYQSDNPDSQVNVARLLHTYRIPLVFLEAYQIDQNSIKPNISVATTFLQEGVASVVTMSHSVLTKSTSIFVAAFYQALAEGQRLGQAMLAGQKALMADSFRFPILGAGELHLTDWFVPILYQEKHDPQLFDQIPSAAAKKMQAQRHQSRLGDLPETPSHTFIGRSRELLALERLLEQTQRSYAVIRGQGGMGKTTLAVELCRWLVRSSRYDRCAFVSLEIYSHARAVLDVLGQQLVGKNYSVAEYGDDLDQAMQPLQRVLENESCLLLLDNMESLLANDEQTQSVLETLQQLQSSDPKTRLLFTSREVLPEPFHHLNQRIELGELSEDDAKALIMQVMANQGLHLTHDDEGRPPEAVHDLIQAVHGHARAIVLLANELAIQGIKATTENLHRVMQQLEQTHPNQRELSLFASVALSIQRLSEPNQAQLKGLAVFQDGGNVQAIAHVLEIETDAARQLCIELIQVGLAEEKGYGYLRLDPALSPYLSLQLSEPELQHNTHRWVEVISDLVDFLYQQQSKDAELSAHLTQLELPNLMHFIHRLSQQMQQGNLEAEIVTGKSGRIEQLLAPLHYPQTLAEVVAIRQRASQQLGEWSHARFEHERLSIDRLLQQGDLQTAYHQAEQLEQRCEQAGTTAYEGADYDLAMAKSMLGQVLRTGGAAEQAFTLFQKAFDGFEALGKQGARMASVSLRNIGECLNDLGQLEQAATAYIKGIQRADKLGDMREIAVTKLQLATVKRQQHDYTAALKGYQQAIELFQQLNEVATVATVYHQMGLLYHDRRQFEQAETAFRQSLSIRTQQNNRTGEADSLGVLGLLYKDWNRPEQAVEYYRQAVDITVELGDKAAEGRHRNNLANTLIQLNRLEQARSELLRAIECKRPYGHASTPWTSWNILYNLEQATGNPQAAQQARQEAIQAFLAYRRDGGENHSIAGRLALAVLEAIGQGDTTEIAKVIEQLLKQEDYQEHKTYLQRLQAILKGDRNPALAEDDNEMNFQLLVELQVLMEKVNAIESGQVKIDN